MSVNQQTILAFDFGMKYIGVAVGQTISRSASPVTTLMAQHGVPNWPEIDTLIRDWKPQRLLVGIPLNMDGTEQPMTLSARTFAEALAKRSQLPLDEVDERLSTWEAKNRVFARDKRNKSLSPTALARINAESAVILIEQWMQG